jgi:CubicO group peptidase (beta-lactamase class C family)
MRLVLKSLKWFFGLAILAVLGLAAWLYFLPPALIQVGAGYAAKIVCSNVFLAGRDPDEVLRIDVQAPGHPLLKLMQVSVDEANQTVTAGLLGIFGMETALMRGEGLGCSSVPDGDIEAAKAAVDVSLPPIAPLPDAPWPEGNRVDVPQDPNMAAILSDPALTGPGMRAVVVVRDGRIVGENYGEGFSAETPLLGWSMAKTVTAAIVGTVVEAGKMSVADTALLADWADGRAAIGVGDLMAMSSGLEFNEDYGDVTDVTRMLYLESDMAAFAAAKPLVGDVGSVFSYSSGTTAVLSRLWQDRVGDEAPAWPRTRLFGPIGMTSAVMEMDARGTFAGSSYVYATARDWARFGQFLLQDGIWDGKAILPSGFVAWMREAAPASEGKYGRGLLWLRGPEGGLPDDVNPDAGFGLPGDIFWLEGHDGQSTAVIPSKRLVVVRLGLTPSKLGYRPQALVGAVTKWAEQEASPAEPAAFP